MKSEIYQMQLGFTKNSKKKVHFENMETGLEAKKIKFTVEDDKEWGDENGDEFEEESYLFDSVCAICDDGGEILCSEGRCMRSFHALIGTGADSHCNTLGFSRAQLEVVKKFLCLNCKYKIHTCYACGKLGSSNKSSGAEVFSCVSATCGHFYHPKCVAKLLHIENDSEAKEFEKKIAAGESFACPVHKCHICNQWEDKDVEEMQFAVCRRFPRSYHGKCLPRLLFRTVRMKILLQGLGMVCCQITAS